MTGQVLFDSYEYAGVFIAAGLVNELRRPPEEPGRVLTALAEVFAIDPPTAAALRAAHVPTLTGLAARLGEVFAALHAEDLDGAAGRLNELLAAYPAHPHLAKEHGRWRLHHHPADAALVPMITAICSEGLARVVAAGQARRLGTCSAPGCGRVFFDVSKNASRRFCSTTCQNRVKAAAFRHRRVTA